MSPVSVAIVGVAVTMLATRIEAPRRARAESPPPSRTPTLERVGAAPTTVASSIPSHLRYASISKSIVVASGAGADVVVAPPEPSVPRSEATPVFTMLHGMCGTAEDICAAASGLGATRGFLVCPAGNGGCGDASDWAGDGRTKARFVLAGLAAAHEALELPRDGARRDVLMGFSRGAFVARDVAYESKGQWVGLVLMGAALTPDADRLRAAGIRRVVLASGELDGAHDTMVAAARKLCAKGLPARFVSFGAIYHALPRDLAARLGPSLDWVRGEGRDEPTCGS